MLLHIFALRWSATATQQQKDQALVDIRQFPTSIPGILSLDAGINTSPHSRGYETIGVLRFASQADLDTYLVHPVHQTFVHSVAPLIEAVDLDLAI